MPLNESSKIDSNQDIIESGNGSAGTPDTNVLTVQGITGGTALPSNLTQVGGVNVSTGTGSSGTGIPRVTVANDSQIKVWDGTNTQAIKAASTAAISADPSAVVALSP